MSDIDSLDIKISAGADNATKSLDKLISKLNDVQKALKFDNSGVKNIASNVDGAMKTVAATVDRSMKKAEQSASTATKKIGKSFADIEKSVKDIGIDFKLTGASEGSIRKKIDSLKNELQTAFDKIQIAEASGKTGSKGYEDAVQKFTITANKITALENQLAEMRMPTQTSEEIAKIAERANQAALESEKMGEALQESARTATIDWEKLNAEAQKVQAEVAKLENGDLGAKIKIEPITANMDKLANKVSDVNRIFKELKVTSAQGGLDKLDKAIRKVQDSYKKLVEQMKISAAHNPAYTSTAAYEKQQAKLEALRNEYARLMNMEEALSRISPWEKAFTSIGRVNNLLKQAVNKVSQFALGFMKVVKNAVASKLAISKLPKMMQNLTKSISRIWRMLRLMLTRMALRKVIENIGTGFKGLALYSEEFDRSLSMVLNTFKQLGYSISAAVGPLVNAFAPALTKVAELAITATNYINQLISALTGKGTWIRAKKQVGSYAESLKGVGKAAKGALRPLDELNNLSSPSSGGSGADDINPDDMFETVDIESPLLNLAQRIKDAWANGDFTDLGKDIGAKIKESLENIDWEGIKETVAKIGTSIASFLNGIFQTEGLGEEFGKTIAEALNTAVEFVASFLETLDWESIGQFIADTVNGFFENFDFERLAEAINDLVNGIWEMLKKAVEEIDWKQAGEKIAEFWDNLDGGPKVLIFLALVPTIVAGVKTIIAALMGLQAAIPVLVGLKDVFLLVAGGAGTLHEALVAVFGGVATIIAGVVAVVAGAVLAVTNFMSMLKNGFSWVKEALMVLGLAIAAVGAVILGVPAAIAAVVAAIVAVVATLVVVIKEHWEEIKKWTSDTWNKIKTSVTNVVTGIKTGIANTLEAIKRTWNNIWTSIKEKTKSIINGIIGFINRMISGVTDGINTIINALNALHIDIPDWVPLLGGKSLGFNLTPIVAPQIPTFAKGGFVENTGSYSLFAAGENGIPEILGTIGGKTAVAGGAEITGIREAIYQTSSEELVVLRQQNQLLQGILEKEFGITKDDIGKAARSYGRDFYNRTGSNAYVF